MFCLFQNLQQEQMSKIRELEREVMTMRGRHSEAIQQLKSHFLQEKRQFQDESESKILSMAKQANKVQYRNFVYFSFIFLGQRILNIINNKILIILLLTKRISMIQMSVL